MSKPRYPAVHPRTSKVAEARAVLTDAVIAMMKMEDITYCEILMLLGEEVNRMAAMGVRSEREDEDNGPPATHGLPERSG